MSDYFSEQLYDQATFQKILPLKGFEFVECTFMSIDFTSVPLGLSKFIDCKFEKCNFSNTLLKNILIRDCSFTDTKLVGVNFCETQTFSTPRFFQCVLDYAVFQNMNLSRSEFKNSSLREVDFFEANLSKADFSGSHLKGTTFNKANLNEADFRGAQEYFIDVRETSVKKAKFNLPEAVNLLTSLGILLE